MNKYLTNCLVFMLFCSWSSFAMFNKEHFYPEWLIKKSRGMSSFANNITNEEPEKLIFIGNPGAGKSTLINSLIGENVAKAGRSIGIGLTKFFSAYEHEGNLYIDTPGLADIEKMEQAAQEIEQALKQNGRYRIFFVLKLDDGRVRRDDVATINTVMDSIKDQQISYNIIINNVDPMDREDLEDPKALDFLRAKLNSLNHETTSFCLVDFNENLKKRRVQFLNVEDGLRDFVLNKSLAISIARENVKPIVIDEFEELKAEFDRSVADLERRIEEDRRAAERERRRYQQQLEEERQAAERDRRQLIEALANQGPNGWQIVGGVAEAVGTAAVFVLPFF